MDDYPRAVEGTTGMKEKKDNKYGQNGKYSDWEISDWARDITRAEKIKNDPEKMKYVKKCLAEDAKAMQDAITSISGLRAKRMKLQEQEDDY